jgi:hypothetical protein
MKTSSKELRRLAFENVRTKKNVENKEVVGFIDMMKYYCAEMKTTEYEVLQDDKIYQRVYDLFDKHKDFLMR